MKNIFSKLRLEKIKDNLIMIINRFPIPVIIIILVSICFFSLLHGDVTHSTETNITKAIFSLIMTFFLSIGVDLNSESRDFNGMKKYLYQLFPMLFVVFFFYTFNSNIDDFENMILFFLSIFGIIGFLFFAPYLKDIISNKIDQDSYYAYFYKIATLFLISFILGGILFALGSLAIVTVDELFGLSWIVSDKIYGDWAIIAMSIFTPLFALTQIPVKTDFNTSHFDANLFFSFLVRYVAIPFVVVYFLILYAYSAKVLLSFGDWPKGEVSWMVIGFSILGYLTYIFSYVFETKNTIIARFRKYLPYIIIPQVFMLFYAIYLRIAQYDLTINRYFVVIFGIWLLVLSLYFIFSKKKYLGAIPALLTLFTIIISIGPWSVYSLPESRQLDRLQNNLTQANIVNGKRLLIPLENYDDIDAKLSGEIYDGIDYLCDFDDCNSIKQLFTEQYLSIVEQHKQEFNENKINNYEYQEVSKWEIVSELAEIIKVRPYYAFSDQNISPSIHYYIDYRKDHFPIDVSGYSELVKLNNNTEINQSDYATINTTKKQIFIYQGGVLSNTLDISNIIDTLSQINGSTQLSPEQMYFEVDGVKILLENISIPNPKYNGDSMEFYESSSGYILIK